MKKLTFLVAALCATMALNAAEVVDVTLANGKYDTDHITWAEVSDNIVLQQLKGSSSTVSAFPLSDYGTRLNKAAKSEDIDALKMNYTALTNELIQVKNEVKEWMQNNEL